MYGAASEGPIDPSLSPGVVVTPSGITDLERASDEDVLWLAEDLYRLHRQRETGQGRDEA
jgi:hypothetical protein